VFCENNRVYLNARTKRGFGDCGGEKGGGKDTRTHTHKGQGSPGLRVGQSQEVKAELWFWALDDFFVWT